MHATDSEAKNLGAIGPYRLLRRLGAGGMAEVYLAVAHGASGFDKKVAIKTLLPDFADDGRLQRLLIEEARIGARLQHRNLVQVHDLQIADGVYYVRMDYVDGFDVATLLRRSRPSIEVALFVTEEIALALDYVHAVTDDQGRPLGLVHRDVSPSNILLSRSGEVKLADFGIAKATALVDITHSNVRKGKFAYMSPEQIMGKALSVRSDQFGLGVTLMEMVCGRRPFDGGNPHETMELIRHAEPPELEGVRRDVAAIIRRALARDPADRFASAEELRAAVASCRRRRRASPTDVARWVERSSQPRKKSGTDPITRA